MNEITLPLKVYCMDLNDVGMIHLNFAILAFNNCKEEKVNGSSLLKRVKTMVFSLEASD